MPNQPVIVQNRRGIGSAGVIVITAVGGLAYWFGIKPWLEKKKAESDLTKAQGSTLKTTDKKKLYDLNGKPIVSANLDTIATDIYGGLHPGWYKPTDQERVVRAFKNTPFGSVPDLEKIYLDKYKENLKDTMQDKLSDVKWISVKNYFK